MQIKSPSEIHDTAVNVGRAKVEATLRHPVRLLVSAIAAGVFIAIGGILSMTVGYGMPEATAGNPGLQRLLCGAMFPIGLILVVILGAELFTGNNATLIPGFMSRHYGAGVVVRNWAIVYLGNFIGAVAFTILLVWLPGLIDNNPWHDGAVSVAIAKTSMPWDVVLLKGIGANWFVCLGVWLAMSGHTLVEKALGCWIPVMAFVALGFEHSIANMFYLPAGMLAGAPVDISDAITSNLIPATIGNIIGGAVFVGCLHTYLHRPHNNR